MARLEVGDAAPEFDLETDGGSRISLSSLLEQGEKGAVIYFYPKAGTPGCTAQACDFRDHLNSFKSAGYAVLGVSADSLSSLKKFREKRELNFPLASDPDHEMMVEYGVWGPKNMYGRIFEGINRSTVVVGKDGKVVLAKYAVRAKGHVERLRKELGI